MESGRINSSYWDHDKHGANNKVTNPTCLTMLVFLAANRLHKQLYAVGMRHKMSHSLQAKLFKLFPFLFTTK